MTERPRIPGPLIDLPDQVNRAAALYVMRRKHCFPEAMWELLDILGLDSVARGLLAERNGS